MARKKVTMTPEQKKAMLDRIAAANVVSAQYAAAASAKAHRAKVLAGMTPEQVASYERAEREAEDAWIVEGR